MRVYNLTNKEFFFRKQSIPANGGWKDYPELDSGILDIDEGLVQSKVLAFGSLPKWWKELQRSASKPEAAKKSLSASSSETVAPSVESVSTKKEWKRGRRE